jgi:lysophospholipase L1-like esterase
MRKLSFTLFMLIVTFSFSYPLAMAQEVIQASNPLPKQGKVLFLGNSITYAGQYIQQFSTALWLKDPNRGLEILNLGLPSETVSGLSEQGHAGGEFPRPDLHQRLERILEQISPDLVIACYGINDGIYLPFDNERFQQYVQGINRLHEKVSQSGARLILLTPPVFDPVHGEAYAEVMHHYANWLIEQRTVRGWEVIDIHWPMFEFLRKSRNADPDFYLAKDGIHPNEQGHWLIARELLKAFELYGDPLPDVPDDFFKPYAQADRLLELSMERMSISRDYWLDKIGHERPGLRAALPEDTFRDHLLRLNHEIKETLRLAIEF